jgi:catechol 2,3-dioxygenase-like lactoylglutathione lyase family enzyme
MMKFRSNQCVAIHVPNLAKAEQFYGGVLGFTLKSRTRTYLEFSTGTFSLFINKSKKTQSPIPSFTVLDARAARAYLKKAGCKITKNFGRAFYFQDPFGLTYDVIGR